MTKKFVPLITFGFQVETETKPDSSTSTAVENSQPTRHVESTQSGALISTGFRFDLSPLDLTALDDSQPAQPPYQTPSPHVSMPEDPTFSASSVGMIFYNVLVLSRRRMQFDELLVEGVKLVENQDIDLATAKRAADELIRRGYVKYENEYFSVSDTLRRIVCKRDLSDQWERDKDGHLCGGWNKWEVMDYDKRFIPIEKVL